ncbi:transcriptional regulator [Segeticoccus rhizosphaerae]|jgi:DNA-binding MarR family transcriptional regulator|uniref:transcriptional regulator n=1 Tax=Segeticoccus rhizosphaerae TaxID=1104777 RepID=UPI0012648326|nr:transcriptional regulator [Segeticoccus rhizosphaerae]
MSAATEGLDSLIHAPARLRIMVTLAGIGADNTLSFARLQQLLDLTAGNLITHLRKLDEGGYVEMAKSRRRGSTETSVHITSAGQAAFDRYRHTLTELLGEA